MDSETANNLARVAAEGLTIVRMLMEKKIADRATIESELDRQLGIHNSNIAAKDIIEFLAENGDIKVEGSNIYSDKSIEYKSSPTGSFELTNSSSATKSTKIDAGLGAGIVGQGGAAVRQNEDGSISFYA